MKRIILTLVLACGALVASAQVDSAALIKAQQDQELLRQQQEMLTGQQTELADQQKAMEQQAKEMSEQEKLIAQQMKDARRAERREAIGRKFALSIDPLIGMGGHSFSGDMLYHSLTLTLGADIKAHYPIGKKWDFAFGVGYQFNALMLTNNSTFDTTTQMLTPYTPLTYRTESSYIYYHTITVPLLLSHVSKNNYSLYFGLRPGIRFNGTFHHNYFTLEGNAVSDRQEVGFGKKKHNQLSRFTCQAVIGGQDKGFLLSSGAEVYFDLVPTICQFPAGEEMFYNEIGIRLSL